MQQRAVVAMARIPRHEQPFESQFGMILALRADLKDDLPGLTTHTVSIQDILAEAEDVRQGKPPYQLQSRHVLECELSARDKVARRQGAYEFRPATSLLDVLEEGTSQR